MNKENLFISIVDRGKAEALLNDIRTLGVSEGVVMLGQGTVSMKLLELLGLDETQKEVIIQPCSGIMEPMLHELVKQNFDFQKKNRGIAFSLPMKRYNENQIIPADEKVQRDSLDYHLLVAIVDHGRSKDVVKISRNAGAPGGTILHGRGAGTPAGFAFDLHVEPEKDIVISVIPTKDVGRIRSTLVKELKLDEPGNGILFVLPVSRVTGIYQAAKGGKG